jgi:hypothetical protein
MVSASSASASQQTVLAPEAEFLPEGQTLHTEKSMVRRAETRRPTAFKRGHSLEPSKLEQGTIQCLFLMELLLLLLLLYCHV